MLQISKLACAGERVISPRHRPSTGIGSVGWGVSACAAPVGLGACLPMQGLWRARGAHRRGWPRGEHHTTDTRHDTIDRQSNELATIPADHLDQSSIVPLDSRFPDSDAWEGRGERNWVGWVFAFQGRGVPPTLPRCPDIPVPKKNRHTSHFFLALSQCFMYHHTCRQ